MKLQTKRTIIGLLGLLFLVSLVLVQGLEVARRSEEAGHTEPIIAVPVSSKSCVECHGQDKMTPGIIDHWMGSTHAKKNIGCIECHKADKKDADAFSHYGELIATIVTPKDCAKCHKKEAEEFHDSHHSKAGNILASLDNFLAEKVEGFRDDEGGKNFFNPHSPTPGRPDIMEVNGSASAMVGCRQCHGSKVGLLAKDGSAITFEDIKPDENGHPTNTDILANVAKAADGRPKFHPNTWPNTGIGRLNLDGSRGSCSACHSRHDFSPRRARQPENCGKCHMGPDHPQKEIYEESKHGVAFRDLKDKMNLDSETWILGKDYTQAPTCATCHMSGNSRNGGKITHDPGGRLSWTNRPPVSLVMDTDINGKVIKTTDEKERAKLTVSSAMEKRNRMKDVCLHCHTPAYVDGFYKQYDDFIVLFNEKFAKPGKAIMAELKKQKLLTNTQFDEKIEWTWFYLWHHEGRRARHGASMMAPDYAHWHGMFEVSERFYMELIPEARELAKHAKEHGKEKEAAAVTKVIDEILSRKEHKWQAKNIGTKKKRDHGLKPGVVSKKDVPHPTKASPKKLKPTEVKPKKDAPKPKDNTPKKAETPNPKPVAEKPKPAPTPKKEPVKN